MDPETEQTNPVDGAQARPEADNSGDSDLDSFLNQYHEQIQQEATPKATEPKAEPRLVKPDLSALDPVIKFAKTKMEQEQQETLQNDINTTVDEIAKGEAFEGLPKGLVRDMVVARAFDDPAFDKAFQNRATDPSGWNTAKQAAAAALAERVQGIVQKQEEAGDRDDIEAAKAAVEGVSDSENDDSGPSVAEMAKMSDAAFNQLIEEELAKAQ